MRKTILIVGASVGWGHMQAAVNVANALSRERRDFCIRVIDIFDYLPPSLRVIYKDGWQFASCHLKWLYGRFYRRSMSRASSRRVMGILVQAAAHRFARDFDHSEISVYVATQGVAASVGSLLKEVYHWKFCVVATDFVLHSLQVFPNVDYYYLPPGCQMSVDPSTAEGLRESARTTGIPIAPEFGLKKDREALRQQFGLSRDLATVLVSFGGAGLRAERHVSLFEILLNLGLPLQFIVLAGRNARFAGAMRRRYGNSKHKDRIKVFDYLNDVSGLYGAADFFMGKAGGLTVSEALASSLPMVIIDTLPGQEDFNAQVISSHGLGHQIRNQTQLAEWINSFLLSETSTASKCNINGFARPDSSMEIARHIAALTE